MRISSATLLGLVTLTLACLTTSRAQIPVIHTVTEGMLRQQHALETVTPEFPTSALERHITGLAVVKIEVDENGDVSRVEPDEAPVRFGEHRVGKVGAPDEWEPRGPFIHDEAVLEAVVKAVKLWKFKPLVVDKKPVRMRTVLTFKFEISKGEGRVGAGTIQRDIGFVTFSGEGPGGP